MPKAHGRGEIKHTEDEHMWSKGTISSPTTGGKYSYCCKHYDEGSQFGIGGGRISKLSIRRLSDGRELYNFDRGLDFDELDEDGKVAYAILLEKYN
jgi:hypothetical protein